MVGDKLKDRRRFTSDESDDQRKAFGLCPGAATETHTASGETQNGYRIKRVASTVYKMTQAQQEDSDSLKGKPLINENEAVTGEER